LVLCVLPALVLAACTHNDSDLFSSTGTPSSPASHGGTTSGDSNGGSQALADRGGTSANNGGSAANQAGTGGSAQPSGGSSSAGNAGEPGIPTDPTGMAGATDGAAGSGEPPITPDPVCGNGVIEGDEQCDDAKHAGQDGCDDNCKVVCSQHGAGTLESPDHHCYNGYDAAPFEGAQQACQQRGAHLATIASAEENAIARKLVNNSKWIGGLEDVSAMSQGTGQYAWLTAEPFDYSNWQQGEPNQMEFHCPNNFNEHCYEHCISLLGDGTWADRRCDMSDGYVCEWEPPTGP
jgi:cysteine-rich repeat protein